MNRLIIAPHMDDEILGCYSVLKKSNVLYIHAPHFKEPNLISKKFNTHNYFHDKALADQCFDMYSMQLFIQFIQSVADELGHIDELYLPYLHDLNKDHRIIAEAGLVVSRPKNDIDSVYFYETPSSTTFNLGMEKFTPNVYNEINIDDKLNDCEYCYPDQFKKFPGSFGDSVVGTAINRGNECGVHFAESFMLLKKVTKM